MILELKRNYLFTMQNSKGKELATISVYLNTGIIATIFGIGFVVAAILFGIATFILKLS